MSIYTKCGPRASATFSAMRIASWLLAMSTAIAITGCGLPRSGPLLSEVEAAHDGNDIVLTPITAQIAEASRRIDHAKFPDALLMAQPLAYDKLAAGDGIEITVWERDGLGVFPAGDGGASNLGEFVLDGHGNIRLPYAGTIHAAGSTTAELHDAVERRWSRLMLAFDVTVRTSARRGQTVTIQGDLQKPGVYPVGPDTARLSGLLGLAAPNQNNPEQTAVTVQRRGIAGTVRLSDLYRENAKDIAILPGDSVIVSTITERLFVLGATGVQGRVKVASRNYSLLDALGDTRALNDSLANPRAVFLMRSSVVSEEASADKRPVVYQFDFTKPDQIALAGKFIVRDGDAVFISDAPFTQVQKLLSTFSATLGTARSVSGLSD
ncbi:polysaccharide biosynthesis/export family protein [Caballeronia glebae]|uniref:Polysaccharide export protein n=1 Tax=Caballeronia glebae TaxID=1777143 RepID=A0A158DFR0_9BURK|nr:polysaccharide biosynthesis/export family protein [Caballeronia glebae]SAK93250.1 polysaccharide export protein [Caballeronia glebae]